MPGKNISIVNGKPLCEHALLAAKASTLINKIYVSTDCPTIKEVALSYGGEIIDRPKELHDPETLTENVLSHAHDVITKKEGNFDLYVLLYANGGFVSGKLIDEAIRRLNSDDTFDSCAGTVRVG